MVSAYALSYALFALAAGPISDRLNRKTVMLSGLAGFILFTFLCGIAPSFAAMCAFRFAAGVSAAFVTPQIWASIPVIVHPSKVLKSMGIATAGLAASQMLGLPLLGTYPFLYCQQARWFSCSFWRQPCQIFVLQNRQHTVHLYSALIVSCFHCQRHQ